MANLLPMDKKQMKSLKGKKCYCVLCPVATDRYAHTVLHKSETGLSEAKVGFITLCQRMCILFSQKGHFQFKLSSRDCYEKGCVANQMGNDEGEMEER